MFLNENYKQCKCGQKLTKRNRFGIKIEAPKNINTVKRKKQGKKNFSKTAVIYCCEDCLMRAREHVLITLNFSGFYFYYKNTYPV